MFSTKTCNVCCNAVMHFLLIMAAVVPTLLYGQTPNKHGGKGSDYSGPDPGTIKIEPVYKHYSRPDLKTTLVIHEKLSPDKGNAVNILEEGFETDFPAAGWTLSEGAYTWARRDIKAHNGSYSAWCIGGGTTGSTLSGGENYPDNLSTVMVYGPFSLEHTEWAELSFFLNLNSEQGYDGLNYMASIDGENFYGQGQSGSTGDEWIAFNLLLHEVPVTGGTANYTGQPEVWILFEFLSDFMINMPNGAFIDDILIKKESSYTVDVGVASIDLPPRIGPGVAIPVTVEVRNFGSSDQQGFPVHYQVDAGAVVTENFPGTLAAGTTENMTFSQTWSSSREGTFEFVAWTSLPGDEDAGNDGLPEPASVIVSRTQLQEIFFEDFESYPTGILGDAPGTKWVRRNSSRTGDVTTEWVKSGTKNFKTASFTTSTETDYALLDIAQRPDQLNLELWYSPDGFFAFDDYARIGLADVTGKATMAQKVSFKGLGVDIKYKTASMAADITVYEQLVAGSGPAPSGTPVHTYIRAEFDFRNSETRFYIGPDENATLQSKVFLDNDISFNALFISGGLNPTFFDDIKITTITEPEYVKDVGAIAMDIPAQVNTGTSMPVGVIVQNFGTAAQSNIPVSYRIGNGAVVTEQLPGPLAPGASVKKTFSTAWIPPAQGSYAFNAWTSLPGDERTENDTLSVPRQIAVTTGITNTAPILETIGNQMIIAGKIATISITANDTDGDVLVFSIPQNPGFLEIANVTQTGNVTTASLVIAPPFTTTGVFEATVQVIDNKGGSDSELFTVEVVTSSKGEWAFQYPPEGTPELRAVYFTEAQTGWVSGRSGTLLKTTNWGKAWEPVSAPYGYINTSIFFADSQTGWVGQTGGTVLKTTNGGQTWKKIATPETRCIQGLFFTDALTGYAVGGGAVNRFVLKTTDGGEIWNRQNIAEGPALMDVYFVNANKGWAVGMSGAVFHTANGGVTWTAQNSGSSDWLEAVFFWDANNGFIAGSSGVLKTTNGGSSYTFDDAGNGWLDDIVFLDQNNGFAIGAIGSTLSKSIDGGGEVTVAGGVAKTWFTEDGGTKWDETLQSVGGWMFDACFADRNTGWAVGRNGLIAKYTNTLPLPTPPTQLVAAHQGNNTIGLSWTDNAANESGFEIFRSDGVSGNFQLLTSVAANTTIYQNTGLANETTYWYRIRAVNAIGASAKSMEAFARVTTQTIPVVTTSSVSEITVSSAKSGGNVTSDGGSPVTAKGVVWGTSLNPTIQNNSGFTSDGTGTGSFVSTLSGLDQLFAYHVRAYATNNIGTAYGEDIGFSTLPQSYAIVVLANPENGGTITGGGTYTHGQEAIITATANPNFNFINWTENNIPVHSLSSYSFLVFSDRTLTANFQNVTGVNITGQETSFQVYPNPTAGSFSVECNIADIGKTVISLINHTGQVVNTWSCSLAPGEKFTVGCNGLSPGLYFLRIRLSSHEQIEKLVIADH